jgi:colicin import membrane protein
MARIGVSYEQVQAAADALVGVGKVATIAAVREALGTGSPNTIHGHLVKWRAARPAAPSAAHELPAQLVNAIGQEIAKAASLARSEIEAVLVQAQAEAQELSTTGESLESQLADIMEQLTETATERDAATATAAERSTEIARLLSDVERERILSSAAQLETATMRLRSESHLERLDTQSKEIASLKDALSKADLARQESVTAAAVSNAKLTAANEALGQTQEREKLALASIAANEKKLAAAASELNAVTIAVQATQARLEAAAREIEELKTSKSVAVADAKKANEAAAELRGRLSALAPVEAAADDVAEAAKKPKRVKT